MDAARVASIRPLAEAYFDACRLECELDMAVLSAFGVADPESVEGWPCTHLVYDDYDASFELWGCAPGWLPPVEHVNAALALGFARCWLVYTDGQERYCLPGTIGDLYRSSRDRSSEAKWHEAKRRAAWDAQTARIAALEQERDELARAILPAAERREPWGIRDLASLAAAHREDSETVDKAEARAEQAEAQVAALTAQLAGREFVRYEVVRTSERKGDRSLYRVYGWRPNGVQVEIDALYLLDHNREIARLTAQAGRLRALVESIRPAIRPLECGWHQCRYCSTGSHEGWHHEPHCQYAESQRRVEVAKQALAEIQALAAAPGPEEK